MDTFVAQGRDDVRKVTESAESQKTDDSSSPPSAFHDAKCAEDIVGAPATPVTLPANNISQSLAEPERSNADQILADSAEQLAKEVTQSVQKPDISDSQTDKLTGYEASEEGLGRHTTQHPIAEPVSKLPAEPSSAEAAGVEGPCQPLTSEPPTETITPLSAPSKTSTSNGNNGNISEASEHLTEIVQKETKETDRKTDKSEVPRKKSKQRKASAEVKKETVMNLCRQLIRRQWNTDECIDVVDSRSRTFKYDAKKECDIDEVCNTFFFYIEHKTDISMIPC